jgi:hypothetical protein
MAKPADLSDTDIDALAAISLSDKVAAAAQWKVDAPPEGALALDATEYVGDA